MLIPSRNCLVATFGFIVVFCFVSFFCLFFCYKFSQYARADELDKMQKEYLDGVANLTAFVDESNRKFSAPVEVSFLDVKMFVQDLEVSFFLPSVLSLS